MYYPNDGTQGRYPAESGVKDYVTLNIILTAVSFLCCGGWLGVLFGVLGIVFGSQCKSAIANGNDAEAESKSKTAKLMAILAGVMIGIGAIVSVIVMLLYGGTIAAAIMAEAGMY